MKRLFSRLFFFRRRYSISQERIDLEIKKGRTNFRGETFGSVDLLPYRGKIAIQQSDISSVIDPLGVIKEFDTSYCTLRGFTLSPGAVVLGVNFAKMTLDGCNFGGIKFKDCSFSKANVKTSSFKGAIFEDCLFKDATADSEGFTHAIVTRSDISLVNFGNRGSDRVQVQVSSSGNPAVVRFKEKPQKEIQKLRKKKDKPNPNDSRNTPDNSFWSNIGAIAVVGAFISWGGTHPSFTESGVITPEEEQRIHKRYEQISESWQEEFSDLEPPKLRIGTKREGIENACKDKIVHYNSYCSADHSIAYFPLYTKERSRHFQVNFLAAEWFVLNHEFAHGKQYKHKHASTLKTQKKELEIEADCLAGMMMASQSSDIGLEIYDEPSMVEDDLSVNIIKLGDYLFEKNTHHGTGLERQKAFLKGYESQNCTNL